MIGVGQPPLEDYRGKTGQFCRRLVMSSQNVGKRFQEKGWGVGLGEVGGRLEGLEVKNRMYGSK